MVEGDRDGPGRVVVRVVVIVIVGGRGQRDISGNRAFGIRTVGDGTAVNVE